MEQPWLLIGGLLMAVTIHAQCPPMCTCSSNQVVCIGVNYTSIPRLIPHATTTLDLSDNAISHVTYASLTSLRNMVNLKLKNNAVSSIDEGAFEAMESLQMLDLSNNHLSAITEETFYGLDKLMHLDISFNNLRHIDGAFTGLSEISRLDLRNNHIQRITPLTFRDLENLRYLFLAGNQISHIDKRAFRHLEKLIYLVLTGNPLHHVPKFEFHSQFLSYIDFSECGLSQIPKGLPNSIRYLQLRRNNITHIDARSFRGCPYISILVLDENGITHIEDSTFESMTYLQQLWLNGNQLTTVPTSLPVSLQRLLMDQNHVTTISQSFARQSQIHTLSFMGNDITHVDHNAFGHLGLLKSLDLSNNQIEHIYGNMFKNNTELRMLQLSKNPLRYMHSHALWGLTQLTTLSLAYIESNLAIHKDAFNDLKQLQSLDLDSSSNLVKTILDSDVLINRLQSITELHMENCALSHLHEKFAISFRNLSKLYISSSNWHCDKNLIWLRDWLTTTTVTVETADEITCYSPRSVHGRSLLSLADDEFTVATTTESSRTSTVIFTTFPTIPSTKATTLAKRPEKSTRFPPEKSTHSPVRDSEDTEYDDGSSDDDTGYGDDYDTKDETLDDDHFPNIDPSLIDFGQSYSDFHSDDDPNHQRRANPFDELFNRSPGRTHPDNPHYNNGIYRYGVTTLNPHVHSSKQETHDPGGGGVLSGNVTIIITIVTIATAIIASIIIALIIYFTRKQRSIKEKPPVYKNGIQYKHKNDVLYFMPNGVSAQQSGEGAERHSTSESVRTNSSVKSKNKDSKEQMTLIPGRDINHEGPMRVYKWEDF